MKANETQLQPVLEGVKQYMVPMFQRSYSWTQKDWTNLWEDLIDLYESQELREHFLGAIVTMPVDMTPHGLSKYLLIDGQQRLTTLFILLTAIRDLARSRNETLADQITELYLVNKWQEGSNQYKLQPTQGDRAVFQQILKGNVTGKSDLVKAYRFFTRMIKRNDASGQPFDLKRIHNILVLQFVVVSIVLGKDENPYVIFESLNAKGEPLTEADLVRNFLFMNIPDEAEQQLAYEDLWMPIQNGLGKELTYFIWRYLTKDGTIVRQTSIYEAYKKRLSNLNASRQFIDILADMHTYYGYYSRLINPDEEPFIPLRIRLHRLNRWEVSTAYPFLLAVYHDYARNVITAHEFCQILDAIESYVIRRSFCRIPTNSLNSMFISMYHSLDRTDLVGSTQKYLVLREWPDDEQFLKGWESFQLYTSGTAKTRHVLESLEQSLIDNLEPVDMTYPRITIEHIMPQTLTDEWEDQLGEFTDQIHVSYLHTIGNLTLTGKNEPMGNASYSEKRKILDKSNFALNKDLTNYAIWNEETIHQRAQALGQVALSVWQRPSMDVAVIRREDPTGNKPTSFTLFGENRKVNSWRDMLEQVLTMLAEIHGESFGIKASKVFGTKRQYISYDKNEMVKPAPIPGTNLWMETNLSSRSIVSILEQIVITCGHTHDDFQAYW